MRALRFCLFFLLAATLPAASPHREIVQFSHTADVGFGNSVFVVGNHPDLGAWDVTKAPKLRFTAGNVWTGQLAVQAGTALQYKYIRRATASDQWCNSANALDLTGVLSLNVTAQPPAPYAGKTIYYLSGWPQANLFHRQGTGWVTTPMTRVGNGRVTGESLFRIEGIGEPGEPLEFVFNNGSGSWDNPAPGTNYLTPLDAFHVQDGNVFAYQPPAVVSAPRIETALVGSTAPNIPDRNVRIYLPRGYDQNTTRRYPVVYLHDGQNVFDPGGTFGSWSADATATREIGQGRMREAILVGIDNGTARIPEYQPPTDSYNSTQGRADAYASFVINNVRPFVDTTYRTLNDPPNTVTLGSSMGGLVSLYLGREFTTFGRIGVFSPAFWTSPNYVNQVAGGTKKPLRVYLDMGTLEGGSYWNDVLKMYDIHLAQQYAHNSDVWFVAGCGDAHNEAAWKARLPAAFRYLLPASEEPQLLAQKEMKRQISTMAWIVRGDGPRSPFQPSTDSATPSSAQPGSSAGRLCKRFRPRPCPGPPVPCKTPPSRPVTAPSGASKPRPKRALNLETRKPEEEVELGKQELRKKVGV